MAPQTHGRRTSFRATLSVTLVLVLSGLLFTANARLSGGEENRQPENFAELVRQEVDRGDELLAEVEGLRSAVDTLSASLDVQAPTLDPVLDVNSGIQAGMTPVTGAGLRVQLDDAPTNRPQPEEIVPDDLVVHQQDLEGVINALWAGGAEAMTLQGERVTALTAFRCVGNVLSLHGRVYSPPYVVEAVGDPDQLRDALDASGPLSIYREYVAAVGLGYDVQGRDQIDVPAFTGSLTLEHATVPEGVDVYR